jgi:hypothetical protein
MNFYVSFPVLRAVLIIFQAQSTILVVPQCKPPRSPRPVRYTPEQSEFVTGNRVAQFWENNYNVTVPSAKF